MVSINVNGRPLQVNSKTVAELLGHLQITAKHIAVEVNEELVPAAAHAEHPIADGDCIEVVTLAGGG